MYLDESMRDAEDGRFNARMPHAAGGRYFQFETGIMGQLGTLVIAGVPDVSPISVEEFRREQVGTETYPYVWLQVRRSKQGLFSFAWRSLAHSVMGMVVPAGGEDTLGSDQDAFIGRFEINGERLNPTPLFHTDHTSEKGFTTTGAIEYADGRIRLAQDGVRAYRFRSRTSDVIAVANFTTVSESIELAGRSIDVPAMDTVLIEN